MEKYNLGILTKLIENPFKITEIINLAEFSEGLVFC